MLVWLLVGMAVTPVLQAALNACQEYGRPSIGGSVANGLRRKLFVSTMQAPLQDLEKVSSGQIIHRITRECGRIGEVFHMPRSASSSVPTSNSRECKQTCNP